MIRAAMLCPLIGCEAPVSISTDGGRLRAKAKAKRDANGGLEVFYGQQVEFGRRKLRTSMAVATSLMPSEGREAPDAGR